MNSSPAISPYTKFGHTYTANVRRSAGGAGELAVDDEVGRRVTELLLLVLAHRRQLRLHLELQLVVNAHRLAAAARQRPRSTITAAAAAVP